MRRFGLIGTTLQHTFSKKYFTRKFIDQKIIDCSYENFEMQSLDELQPLLVANPEIEGLNITMPYKKEVLSYLNEMDAVVKETSACNCIRIKNGKLYGFNTDTTGFKNSIIPQLKPYHRKALILGSGGASSSVQYVFRNSGIAFMVVSRNKEKGDITYKELNKEIMDEYLVIVNTTPAGMYPHSELSPSIDHTQLTSRHFLFDLVYHPARTKFLEEGEKRGAQVMNGYEMLVEQAEESWRIWNSNSN